MPGETPARCLEGEEPLLAFPEEPNLEQSIMSDTPGKKDGGETPPESLTQRQRVQFDFSPEAYAGLREIRDLAGAKTNAEVVRNALRVYRWFLKHKLKNHRIQVVEPNPAADPKDPATKNIVREVELIF